MGLANSQRLLARICTDATLRERFLADPPGLGAGSGLTADEAALLAELPAARVRQFADALAKKRYRDITKLLPRSHRVLGDEAFLRWYAMHARRPLPAGTRKSSADAIAFANLAVRALRSGENVPAWAVDLLRFEAALLAIDEPGRRWTVVLLRHAVTDLVNQADATQGEAASIPTRWSLLLWFRVGRTGRLRHLSL